MTPTVLLVAADPADADLARAALAAEMRDAAVWVRTLGDAIDELDTRPIACVVLDLRMPDVECLGVLEALLAAHPHVPIVALGGADDGVSIEAVRRGAQDHLSTAELASGMLGRSVAFALERARNQTEIAENREHYRSVIEAVGEGVIVEGADGRIQYANAQAARILGRGVDEVLGWAVADALQRAVDVLHRRLPADQHPGRVALRTGTPVIDVTMGLRRPSGELQWIEVNAHPLMKSPGTPPYAAVIALRDITERKQSQEAMRQLSALVESSGDSIVCTTLEGTILTWNAGAERLHGYRADEVIGSSAMVLADGADSVDVLLEAMRAVALGESLTGVETTRRHKDGHSVHVSLTISPILGDDSQVTGCSFIGRDITARIELQRALAHQAVHDSLTGLPNRTLLVDRLEMALARARRNDRRVAVYFLDLDEFKLVNDGLGHLAGDQLLIEVAHRLLTCVRPDDTVARFGGDEFVIVCDSPSSEVAAHLGDRMLEVLRPPIALADAEIFVTASIGLVIADRDAIPEEVLRDADSAMYRAKERGRARVELFDRSLHDLATWKLQSAADLRRALERDELRVFYQPILDLDSGQPAAVEALLRWQHPALGLVSPELFIPLAEETGMIVPIGRWVLEQALRDRAAWEVGLPGHDHLRLAVNLSGRQLSDRGLVEGIADTLCAAQVDPGSVILEVTETVLMRDPGSLSTLQAIHDLGISLHVDDFGTGYSSLSYLKTMPIDAIKVDRSFTDGLSTDPDDEAIVTAVVALARALELEVIAEGLETPAQLQALRELGCDHGQGFLFARPMPADQLTTWLSSMPTLAGGRYEAALWPLESLAALSAPHV